MASPNAIVVETPERVALSLDVADLGHRVLAFLVDLGILLLVAAVSVSVAGWIRPLLYQDFLGLSSLIRALLIAAAFVLNWSYDIVFETLWNGQTPGKRLLRIRVVRDDGSPEGFFEAVARNVCRLVDSFPAVYGVGVITMIASPRGKRLGDYVAGTTVVRERHIDLARYETKGAPASPVNLTPEEFELVSSFLGRAPSLEPEARGRVVRKLAEPIVARLAAADRDRVLATPEATEAFLRRIAGK